jgi:hypothetical protein
MAPTEELTAGYYTAKTNSTWIESQVFQSGTIPQTSIDLLEGSARRVMIFHNLPATVPYRVRVQARGGASSDYWSAWSDWVIIKPMAPDAQRVYLNPSTNIIRIEPQPGIIRVAIDWSAGTSPVKAAADRYFAGMLITYTEGESLSGLSQLSKNPAATPVPLVPWKNISSRTGGQITVMTPDNCVTLPVEPLCHARIVLQVILRDGTLSAPMEVGYESGAVICVSPRGVADGQGTQPPSFNDLVNSGGSIAGGYNGVTIVPIHAFIPEVNGTTPTWQLVDSFYLGMYYDNYGDIPADIYIRLVGLRVNAKLAAYNAWSVRVTVAGSPAKVYTLTMVPSGVGGWLPLDEVLHLPDYNHVTIEVQVAPGGSQTATSVQVALVTRLEPNYIPPSA